MFLSIFFGHNGGRNNAYYYCSNYSIIQGDCTHCCLVLLLAAWHRHYRLRDTLGSVTLG